MAPSLVTYRTSRVLFSANIHMVGGSGLEPLTSAMSTLRSGRLS